MRPRTLNCQILFLVVTLPILLLAACSPAPVDVRDADPRLKVVATTTLVGGVVDAVAGDLINLVVLMPVGVDPHSFEPVPRDIAAVTAADLIFLNGLDVETFLDEMIVNAGGEAVVLSVSEGIKPLVFGAQGTGEEPGEAREYDPHVWGDPLNVVIWTRNIADALTAADPANAGVYRANAEAYERVLVDLDQWAQDQVTQIPESERLLVTDHDAYGYFADRYGFTLVGSVIPGFSTLAEPSAQELAALEDSIKAVGVKAIFVGNTVNPSLINRVAQDTGTLLVYVYTGSLSEPGGPAADYPAYIRYNVTAIVDALTTGEAE